MDKSEKVLNGQDDDDEEQGKQISDASWLSLSTRLKGFIVCFTIGIISSLLSIFFMFNLECCFLLFLVFYAFGNNAVLLSTCFLIDPSSHLKRLFAETHLIATPKVLISDASWLSWSTRLKGFIICFTTGIISSLLSTFFLFIPGSGLILFAVFYTFGNFSTALSTYFLMSPYGQLRRLFGGTLTTQLFAITTALICLNLTLCAVFWWRIAGLSIVFCVLQYLAMTWYALSYIPFASFVHENNTSAQQSISKTILKLVKYQQLSQHLDSKAVLVPTSCAPVTVFLPLLDDPDLSGNIFVDLPPNYIHAPLLSFDHQQKTTVDQLEDAVHRSVTCTSRCIISPPVDHLVPTE